LANERQAADEPKTGPQPCSDVSPAKEGIEGGITLFDLAFAIEADELAATNLVRTWINNKWLSAKPIGKCPLDGRGQRYRLSELLSDAKDILSLSAEDQRKYRQALAAKVRLPK
jgi:hypothetical protein